MISKKLAIAAATALMLASMGAAHAADSTSPTTPESGPTTSSEATGLVTELTNLLGAIVPTVATPDITAIGGAINVSTINGSIDISGTNVSITGVEGAVSAKAEAIGETTSNATAFAINGSNFSTTVIGAMNSSTLDVMGKTTDLAASVSSKLGVGSLAGDGGASMATGDIAALTGLTGAVTGSNILSGTAALDVANLSSELSQTGSSMVEELQSMNVYNMALNAAPIVAGLKISAVVDPNAWFLNPQTGIVNVSNMQVATTAIGAMNSSITHLGKNLTTLAK